MSGAARRLASGLLLGTASALLIGYFSVTAGFAPVPGMLVGFAACFVVGVISGGRR